jgi:beta-glucosidase
MNANQLAERFPHGFVWGTATASYQIEGSVSADGRGESIWDRFSHTPGMVRNGDTGDVADDHYRRWKEDLGLMRDLGVNAYRFSVAWPRIFPDGRGSVNEAGLAWYERLVDALLEEGIQPWVTLYHWDLPQALQDRGGWTDPATVDAFADYAELIGRRLGDRVVGWITHNEPWVAAFLGHYQGRHAPGIADLGTALRVAHNLLLSHGRAVARLRALSGQAQVGITLNLSTIRPASGSAEDAAAAQRSDGNLNRWFLDPLFGRGYPADMLALYGGHMPPISDADLAEIAAPLDFLGINSYFPSYVRSVPFGPGREWGSMGLSGPELNQLGLETTEVGWAVAPDALRELLAAVSETYRPQAIYVTENGAAFPDQLVEGAVQDPRRVAYLASHIDAVAQAIAAGVPVRGYFVWSLLDNFEWAHGYSIRFGIIYVDYENQRRILKDSGRWYGELVRAARARMPTPIGGVDRR